MTKPHAKHKTKVRQKAKKTTQAQPQAVSNHQSRSEGRPNNVRDGQTPTPVRPTGIPLPSFNWPITAVHQQDFFQHQDDLKWQIKIGHYEFRIQLSCGTRASHLAQGPDTRTWELSMPGWNDFPKGYGVGSLEFFTPGRVFAIPWPREYYKCFSAVKSESNGLGEQHFVLIESSGTHFYALPISPYNGQGVQAPGVVASEHSTIYTTENAPTPLQGELASGLRPISIKVEPFQRSKSEMLHSPPRVNYGTGCYVRLDVPVRNIGAVQGDSLPALLQTYQSVWSIKSEAAAQVQRCAQAAQRCAQAAQKLGVDISDLTEETRQHFGQASAAVLTNYLLQLLKCQNPAKFRAVAQQLQKLERDRQGSSDDDSEDDSDSDGNDE